MITGAWIYFIANQLTLAGLPALPRLSESAYLDPGSGSFILQIILAALLGSLFVFKSFWRKMLDFFRSLGKKSANEEDHPEDK